MDPFTAAALVGGGTALLGGIMSSRSNRAAAEANAAAQERYAKEGIRWKVADAKAAGISPEYALGANTTSFNPTYTGSQQGNIIADAGQNIARAAMASEPAESRKINAALQTETLRGMKLDNDIKQSQMTRVNVPGNPAFPSAQGNVIEGQGNSPVKDVPLERTGQSLKTPHSEGGSIPSVGWAQTADGGLRPVPSQDIKNRIEDQLIPESVWAAQNIVAPNFGKGPKPPSEALPKGHFWRWSVSRQAWYPSKGKRNFGDTAWEWYEKNLYNKRALSGRKYHRP